VTSSNSSVGALSLDPCYRRYTKIAAICGYADTVAIAWLLVDVMTMTTCSYAWFKQY
ncbi:Hypothetical predicted protein, partial [Olea europaea subsp. europaea]